MYSHYGTTDIQRTVSRELRLFAQRALSEPVLAGAEPEQRLLEQPTPRRNSAKAWRLSV